MFGSRNSKATKIVVIIFAMCLDMALGTDLDGIITTLNDIIQCQESIGSEIVSQYYQTEIGSLQPSQTVDA